MFNNFVIFVLTPPIRYKPWQTETRSLAWNWALGKYWCLPPPPTPAVPALQYTCVRTRTRPRPDDHPRCDLSLGLDMSTKAKKNPNITQYDHQLVRKQLQYRFLAVHGVQPRLAILLAERLKRVRDRRSLLEDQIEAVSLLKLRQPARARGQR